MSLFSVSRFHSWSENRKSILHLSRSLSLSLLPSLSLSLSLPPPSLSLSPSLSDEDEDADGDSDDAEEIAIRNASSLTDYLSLVLINPLPDLKPRKPKPT